METGTELMIIAMFFSAAATVAIAIYAIKSHKLANKNYQLAQEIKKANELKTQSDDEYRQQVSDLYKAIVISNIVANRPKPIDHFKEYYKQAGGKIKIFD